MRTFSPWIAGLGLAAVLVAALPAQAQAPSAPPQGPAPLPAPLGDGTILLTIFLKHDQSRPLGKINEQLKEQGFFQAFPPQGIQVVSWYVVMGIGQVVTLRVPAERLREVNLVLENTAWGGYHTEFYPTYDFKAVAEKMRTQAAGGPVPVAPVIAAGSLPAGAQAYLEQARKGDANAMRMLGVMYYHGLNVPQDREKGLYWYRQAAAKGSEAARSELNKIEGGQ
jgi:hypothetical protein